jgi:hypothetical protein
VLALLALGCWAVFCGTVWYLTRLLRRELAAWRAVLEADREERMNKTVPVVARLRLPDGRLFDCHSTVESQHADTQESWWTEGNGACDCNRSLELNRAHGLKLGIPDDDDEVPCLPCGNTIMLVSLTVDGKTLVGLRP